MKKKKKSKPYYRFTVDHWSPEEKMYDHTVELTSEAKRQHERVEVIERADHTFVDEVVISPWLHIEAMSRREYWTNIGGVTLFVHLRKDGSVKYVRVHAAGQYDLPRDGVTYFMDCGRDDTETGETE